MISHAPLPAFNKQGKPAGLATRLLERIKDDQEKDKEGDQTASDEQKPIDLTECGHADVTDVITALHAAQYAGWSCRLDASSKFVRIPKGHQMPVPFPGNVAGGAEACTPADCEAIGLDPLPLPKAPDEDEQKAQFQSYATGTFPAQPAQSWHFRGHSYTAQGNPRADADAEAAMKRRSDRVQRAAPDGDQAGAMNPTQRGKVPGAV